MHGKVATAPGEAGAISDSTPRGPCGSRQCVDLHRSGPLNSACPPRCPPFHRLSPSSLLLPPVCSRFHSLRSSLPCLLAASLDPVACRGHRVQTHGYAPRDVRIDRSASCLDRLAAAGAPACGGWAAAGNRGARDACGGDWRRLVVGSARGVPRAGLAERISASDAIRSDHDRRLRGGSALHTATGVAGCDSARDPVKRRLAGPGGRSPMATSRDRPAVVGGERGAGSADRDRPGRGWRDRRA